MKKAITLFSGGGGVDLGLRACGIQTAIAVEGEPDGKGISKLSSKIADIYAQNFPETKLYRMPVEQWVKHHLNDVPDDIYALHASPVCSNYSGLAKLNKTGEQIRDIEQAIAICKAIKHIQPEVFTLENVRNYQDSLGFKNILTTLKSNNYHIDFKVVNCADYGIPQSRIRLLLIASKQPITIQWQQLRQPQISWYDAIKDLIPNLETTKLLSSQELLYDSNLHQVIQRSGAIGKPKIRNEYQPFWTLTKMIATDQKLNNRNKFADIVFPNGNPKTFDIHCLRAIATFPTNYKMGKVGITGAIFGYAVPPKLIEVFYSFLIKYL
jgi:DNA (cytosine-5)-methyltransferase 1